MAHEYERDRAAFFAFLILLGIAAVIPIVLFAVYRGIGAITALFGF